MKKIRHKAAKSKAVRHTAGKNGIIGGLTVTDFATIAFNAQMMGVGPAATQAFEGDYEGAGATLVENLTSNIPGIIAGNLGIYIFKKVAQKVIPPKVRKYLV